MFWSSTPCSDIFKREISNIRPNAACIVHHSPRNHEGLFSMTIESCVINPQSWTCSICVNSGEWGKLHVPVRPHTLKCDNVRQEIMNNCKPWLEASFGMINIMVFSGDISSLLVTNIYRERPGPRSPVAVTRHSSTG